MQPHEFFERRSVQPAKTRTRLAIAGGGTKGQRGLVNPAVFHGSTALYPTAEDLHACAEFTYGRHGSPTTRALQDVLMAPASDLRHRDWPRSRPHPALDHVLVTDNVYRPSRNFRNGMLAPPPKSRMRAATLRPRIGLENVDDLKADLDAALQR